MDPIREFKAMLEQSLDTHFPKGECEERGAALMMFAEAVIGAHQLIANVEKNGK